MKVISSVLSNLAAGWIEIASLLTYSVSFAIVSMLAAARIKDQLDNGKF